MLKNDGTTVVLVTVDAVAIGEIGRIGNDFLASGAGAVATGTRHPAGERGDQREPLPRRRACGHRRSLTVQAVKEAWQSLVPVKVGAGTGHEDRISENRRLKMKDGSEVDMRRAYSMPRDEDVAAVGPIDPQIGLLRLDREDGRPLAVLYNFACHPIMNPPSKGNSADFPGFASKVIEEALGDGAVAFFVQGCGGDINPVRYKEVQRPPERRAAGKHARSQRPAGVEKDRNQGRRRLSGSSTKSSRCRAAADFERRIAAIQAEQAKLLQSLKPTNINFKTFLPLFVQHKMSPDFPSFYCAGLSPRSNRSARRT